MDVEIHASVMMAYVEIFDCGLGVPDLYRALVRARDKLDEIEPEAEPPDQKPPRALDARDTKSPRGDGYVGHKPQKKDPPVAPSRPSVPRPNVGRVQADFCAFFAGSGGAGLAVEGVGALIELAKGGSVLELLLAGGTTAASSEVLVAIVAVGGATVLVDRATGGNITRSLGCKK